MEAVADQYACPLHKRFHDFITKNPAWGNGQDQFWVHAINLLEQGATFDQAIDTMGFRRVQQELKAKNEKLEKQHKQDSQIIEAGRRQDIVKDRAIEERDQKIEKLEREIRQWEEHAKNPRRSWRGRIL